MHLWHLCTHLLNPLWKISFAYTLVQRLIASSTSPVSSKCCPRRLSFIRPNKWKSEGAWSGLLGGCGTNDHPIRAITSDDAKEMWGRALSWCNWVALSCFSGLFFRMATRSFLSDVMERSLFIIACLTLEEIEQNQPFVIPEDIHHNRVLTAVSWISSPREAQVSPTHRLILGLRVICVCPGLITSAKIREEKVSSWFKCCKQFQSLHLQMSC